MEEKFTFDEYQQKAALTAKYMNGENVKVDELTNIRQLYPFLGLSGEVGELLNKVKKIIRDNNGAIGIEKLGEIKAELGDVLWYLAAICSDLGLDMDHVAKYNIQKLLDRYNRNVIQGSGDNR